jgi:phosphomethylpyrimidine synthase
MTLLRAIPCPAVSPRRSFSAKMGALMKEDASMCGPHFCSMKITEDVRKFAAEHGITEKAAIQQGLEEKATEFAKAGDAYRRV